MNIFPDSKPWNFQGTIIKSRNRFVLCTQLTYWTVLTETPKLETHSIKLVNKTEKKIIYVLKNAEKILKMFANCYQNVKTSSNYI